MSYKQTRPRRSHTHHKNLGKISLEADGICEDEVFNAGKIPTPHFKEIQGAFVADITAEVVMNEIPDELVINWDQTALHNTVGSNTCTVDEDSKREAEIQWFPL